MDLSLFLFKNEKLLQGHQQRANYFILKLQPSYVLHKNKVIVSPKDCPVRSLCKVRDIQNVQEKHHAKKMLNLRQITFYEFVFYCFLRGFLAL